MATTLLYFIMFLNWKQLNIFVKIMYLNSESIFYQCDREQGKELHMYQCNNILSPGSSCHVKQFCLCILTWLNVGFIGLICDSVTTLSIVFIVNLCSTTIMTMRPHLVHDQRGFIFNFHRWILYKFYKLNLMSIFYGVFTI